MAPALPHAKRKVSDREQEESSCPVCMDPTKDDWFSFPCGHLICSECNEKMVARSFLACPTCRTPREGVSERQVESANRSRVAMHAEQDAGTLWAANGIQLAMLFFPDETGGANPFTPLMAEGIAAPATTPGRPSPAADEALARVLQAEDEAGGVLPLRRASAVRLRGPLRALVGRLLSPGSIADFLAQREVVRRQRDPEL